MNKMNESGIIEKEDIHKYLSPFDNNFLYVDLEDIEALKKDQVLYFLNGANAIFIKQWEI